MVLFPDNNGRCFDFDNFCTFKRPFNPLADSFCYIIEPVKVIGNQLNFDGFRPPPIRYFNSAQVNVVLIIDIKRIQVFNILCIREWRNVCFA